jgi:hypothetical protein
VAESEMVKVPQDVIKSMKEENALLQDEIASLNNEIKEKGKVIFKLLEDGIKQKLPLKGWRWLQRDWQIKASQ